ncbi:MAG TPA: hypothetical protein VIJ67_13535 [Pseudolabrys sp.]|jgi:hypothetical protein
MKSNPGKTQGTAHSKARAATEGRDEKRERATLDACYGRIGIPAVAAALTPRHHDRRPTNDRRFTPYDRD